MGQKKKIKGEPSLLFTKKIVELSKFKSWNMARLEWIQKCCYSGLNEYKSCLCSARALTNVTIIVNKNNSNHLGICNSCAELYLGIYESEEIMSSVRRLKHNMKLGMNKPALDYLLNNQAISVHEHQCYSALKSNRKDTLVSEFRENINKKLINFINYSNKSALEKIDAILVWATKHPEFDIEPLAIIRNDILGGGVGNIEVLDDIIDNNKIELKLYGKKDTETARKSLNCYIKNVDSYIAKAHIETIPYTTEINTWGMQCQERKIKTQEEYLLKEGLVEFEGAEDLPFFERKKKPKRKKSKQKKYMALADDIACFICNNFKTDPLDSNSPLEDIIARFDIEEATKVYREMPELNNLSDLLKRLNHTIIEEILILVVNSIPPSQHKKIAINFFNEALEEEDLKLIDNAWGGAEIL